MEFCLEGRLGRDLAFVFSELVSTCMPHGGQQVQRGESGVAVVGHPDMPCPSLEGTEPSIFLCTYDQSSLTELSACTHKYAIL